LIEALAALAVARAIVRKRKPPLGAAFSFGGEPSAVIGDNSTTPESLSKFNATAETTATA
jgi:hypothetical protein